ncbi:MAG TPA: FixH family protein [Burkholderiales bacterium]|nr:FixH family protein [Burkholderiales bacterium]
MSGASRPWYREPWPWLLMSGPAAVLLAGSATMWLAWRTGDSLVAEDYYKRGLAINRVLAREEAARQLGIAARLVFENGKLQVQLAGDAPEALFVQLAHATRAGLDTRLRLARVAPGRYEAALGPLARGHWHATIDDPAGRWRVAKEIR